MIFRVPGWPSWVSIQLLISAQIMISQFVSSSPTLGSVLTVPNLLGILSAHPLLTRSLILSLKNKLFFKKKSLKGEITAMVGLQQLRELSLNSEYHKNKWIYRGKVVSGWKITKRRYQEKADSG